MKTFLPFLFIILTSCYNQDSTTLTFVNRSSFDIDSIIIHQPGKNLFGKLTPGQQYSKHVKNIDMGTNEGSFPFAIYINGKVMGGSWGLHDYGMLSSKKEIFYIYDNGISYSDKPLQKPGEFRLYFYNASSQTIDSIVNSNGAIIKVNESTPRNFEVVYDYAKIENIKQFVIAIGGKVWRSPIEHDFSNWNYNQAFFYFENDSLKKGTMPWREPLEFIVDLSVKLPFPSDSVSVASDALVKTYYSKQPNSLTMVFDFKKLEQSPVINITALNKKYKIDLSSHDFSNIYYNQKIFYLEKKGIRSLTY